MTDARDRILERLRRRQSTQNRPAVPPAPRNPLAGNDLIQQFTERMESVRAEVFPVARADWAETLVDIASSHAIQSLLYGADGPLAEDLERVVGERPRPRLVAYDTPVETWKEALFFDTDAAVTSSLAAIAETGTLVLWPRPQEPRLMSLVPPVHFAIVEASRMYATFADLVSEQDWAGSMPTNALLISGPSKSADIEQTLAYGVHGPRELIVLLVAD